MISLSPAAAIAWKIAASEAQLARSECIEKVHLFIGILSLDKALLSRNYILDKKDTQEILKEKNTLDFPLRNTGMDAVTIRRNIRTALTKGSSIHHDTVIHRSLACKKIFEQAFLRSDGKDVTCIHLFNSILNNPGTTISGVLDRALGEGEQSRNAVLSASMRLVHSVKDYQKAQENKDHIFSEIRTSQDTLSRISKESGQYRQLKLDLMKKTLALARICLQINDTAGLLVALRELVSDSGCCKKQIEGIITQIDYMHTEGIGISERTAAQLCELMERLECQMKNGAGL